jgi:hypothetical protein
MYVRPFQGGVAVYLITRGDGKARGARVASAPGWYVWAPSGQGVM